MTPQDRPARCFDEPPAYEDRPATFRNRPVVPHRDLPPTFRYEDLELRPDLHPDDAVARDYSFLAEWLDEPTPDPDIAARSHLGAIVIVASVVVLVVIAAALFLRGAS